MSTLDTTAVIAGLGTFQIVDLSATIAPSPPGTPDWQRTEIEYQDNAGGAKEFLDVHGIEARLLRDGEGPAVDLFTRFGTHNSTHVDAPRHYNSTIDGEPSMTVDQLPLSWFIGPGVVIDATGREDGDALTAEDVQSELERIGHELTAGDILLVRTGCDAFYNEPDYLSRGPGVSGAATRWIYEQGVRVVGVDAWGWDAPTAMQAARTRELDQPGIMWEAHQLGLSYSQLERLVNLGSLPSTGFYVIALPLKIENGSGAPSRVVALVP